MYKKDLKKNSIISIITFLLLIFTPLSFAASQYSSKLNQSDISAIKKIDKKIERFINSKGYFYKDKLVSQLSRALRKLKKDSRKYLIIEKIIENTKKVNLNGLATKEYNKYGLDINIIKSNWINWHNTERAKLGLKPYSYDARLDNSAFEWSLISEDKGVMEHKRNYGDKYYDYNKIEAWFNERDVNCKVINRTTSSESIGKFGYYCSESDCTDELVISLKKIFDLYMAEVGLPYPQNAHYKAITSPVITKMGLGLAIKELPGDGYQNYKSYDYYATTHYCTEFKK